MLSNYMPDSPTLLDQLASRAKSFHSATGIPQTLMAKAIGMEASNYNSCLQGRKGLGAESTCLLLRFIAMPKREVIAKFSKPIPSSKIVNLQVQGTSTMRLDNDGYVPGQSGVDPVSSGSIDNTPDADVSSNDALIGVLRQVRSIHRKVVRAISEYILQSKVNQGSTDPTNQRFSTRNIVK